MKSISLLVAALVVSTAVSGAVVKNKKASGDLDWWKHAVFYQIYPRSFKDSNNDGIGDLKGIIDKLDHFPDAGVTAVWLSPIFRSPQVDQGYDISNYTDIEPDYGTIEQVEELVEKAHKLGIKIILDFVPNHTSDQHQWFQDSVKGVEEYRDYYLWVDGVIDEEGNRKPPNNWISVFKNSAWTWNEERQQYYFHQFAPAQPDLNYHNPKVVAAMKDVIVFWLDRGVDGFRIDAVPHIFEIKNLTDEPETGWPGFNNTDYEFLDHIYTKDQPETYKMIYEWRKLVDEYTTNNGGDQRVLMTEAYTDINKTVLYYGTSDGSELGAHFTFNFDLITDVNINSTAQDIVNAVTKWLTAIPEQYTSNWVIGNHDNHRAATRFGPNNVDGFNMLNLLLPGVGVTYNGEEIGQENGEVTFEEGQDPSARDPAIFDAVSRDFERTPFQWDDTVNAGFNEGAKPWLPVSEKYNQTNLKAQQEAEGNSHFKIYQELTKLRQDPIAIVGTTDIKALDDDVILLKRSTEDGSLVLLFNNNNEKAVLGQVTDIPEENTIILVSVDSTRKVGTSLDVENVELDPHESIVIRG